jgi:hypothetical protein
MLLVCRERGMKRRLLKHLNSPIGILLLTSVIVAPSAYFINYVWENRSVASRRLDIEDRCDELFERNIEIRLLRDRLLNRAVLDGSQGYSEVAELFVKIPSSIGTSTDDAVNYTNDKFKGISFTVLVDSLEDATRQDDQLSTFARRIKREHDVAFEAYRKGDVTGGRLALTNQHQEIINCREYFE